MSLCVWSEIEALKEDAFSSICHESVQEKYVALLLVRITDICGDCMAIIAANKSFSVPILLRSALESYIDLMCLISDPGHIEQMNSSFNGWMAKKFKDSDPLRSKIFNKKVTRKDMKIWEKFEMVHEEATYKGFYSHLCRNSHGNIEILVSEHAVNGMITVSGNPDLEKIKLLKNQTIGIVSKAMKEGLSFLKADQGMIDRFGEISELSGNGSYI